MAGTSINDILAKINSNNSVPFSAPKQTIEQQVTRAASYHWNDVQAVRMELAQDAGSKARRTAKLDLENQIKAALAEGKPVTRWSKNQTLAQQLSRLPGAPSQSSKLTREEKEDFGMGAYLAGQWTEWGR